MENDKMATTIIAEDVEITGSVKCASDLEINGKLNGDLICTASVVIGDSAQIKGNITVDAVTIQGQINGNVMAKDRIELKSTARLDGDIKAKRLTVEDGVTFVGKAEVNPSGGPVSKTGEPPNRSVTGPQQAGPQQAGPQQAGQGSSQSKGPDTTKK